MLSLLWNRFMASHMEPILTQVRETIERHAMLEPCDLVLAAVSGGPDSVCLLHALLALGYRIEVAHLDHGTRDGESSEDAVFVREMADRLSLPFHGVRCEVESMAAESKDSFEEVARHARYEFLLRTTCQRNCAALATGHHADDQAETVLMRLLRGTTPRGLGGIPPVRMEGSVRIVRPLIACTREDILGYLTRAGISWRTDRTNTDTRYPRNRIRHELLPALERDYNPQVRAALCRLAEVQRGEDEFVLRLATEFLEACLDERGRLCRSDFSQGHVALQRRALVLLGWSYGVDLPFERVDEAVRFVCGGGAGRAFDLGGGLLIRNTRRVAELVSETETPGSEAVPLTVPGETAAFGRRFCVRRLERPPSEPVKNHCTPWRQLFDADALGVDLAVRHRLPGDRFTPLGMDGTRKLKDYFIDLGLAHSERNEQVLLVTGGRIAWVVGRAIDAAFAVHAGTRDCIEVEVTDAAE